MLAAKPVRTINRPTAWMKRIPAIAWFTTSAITAVPHDLLDLRSVGNAYITQCLVIEVHQGRNSPVNLPLLAPVHPKSYDRLPARSKPAPVKRSTGVKRRG